MRTSVHTCKSFIPTVIHITPAKGSSLIILPGVYIWTTSPCGKCKAASMIWRLQEPNYYMPFMHLRILCKIVCFHSHYNDNNQFNYFQNTTVRITWHFGFRLEPILLSPQLPKKWRPLQKWSKVTEKWASRFFSINPWHTLYAITSKILYIAAKTCLNVIWQLS